MTEPLTFWNVGVPVILIYGTIVSLIGGRMAGNEHRGDWYPMDRTDRRLITNLAVTVLWGLTAAVMLWPAIILRLTVRPSHLNQGAST